jgi:hypothetical protein
VEERAARRLGLAPDEYDQVLRLRRFREAYPAVVIGAGKGWWQALIFEPNGEIVTTRFTLRALLDKLDELFSGSLRTTSRAPASHPLSQLATVLRKTSSRCHCRNSRPGRSARRSGRSITCPALA